MVLIHARANLLNRTFTGTCLSHRQGYGSKVTFVKKKRIVQSQLIDEGAITHLIREVQGKWFSSRQGEKP